MGCYLIWMLLLLAPSEAVGVTTTAKSFDHAGSTAHAHALSGLIITSVSQHEHSQALTAEAALTHCFPAQLHDGFYLIKSAAWLLSSNATTAFELCGTDLLNQTQASIGILQASHAECKLEIFAVGHLLWQKIAFITSGSAKGCPDAMWHAVAFSRQIRSSSMVPLRLEKCIHDFVQVLHSQD